MRSFNLNDYYTKKAEELLKGYDEYEYDLIKWKDHIPEFGDTKKEIILKTVSYTHLTLPTKRIV